MMAPCSSTMADVSLTELTCGPYFNVASNMDQHDLCQMDATCRLLRKLNCTLGPWRSLGVKVFNGMELEERDGIFKFDQDLTSRIGSCKAPAKKSVCIDWKKRYRHFKAEIQKFCAPFEGTEIMDVQNPDEVAYCKCKFYTGIFEKTSADTEASCVPSSRSSEKGVYLEVEVLSNADNLSLAVADFDNGGKSSVTFSPDTGAVIKETKIQESPRRVKGAYIQPLEPKPDSFEGNMGLFVYKGQIAFFRRWQRKDSEKEEHPWESTGFIIGVSWAEGRRLSPCLAFRNEGSYKVRLSRVDSAPPFWPQKTTEAFEEANWMELNWEGAEP